MLDHKENIVLFTPAVAPPLSRRADDDALSDPFEPLGRALAKHHGRIKHVPYVHEMTQGHLNKLREAHAAIVVVCDAAGAARSVVYDASGSVRSRGSNLEDQVEFAKAVNRTVDAASEDTQDDGASMLSIPVVLVLVTENLKENFNGRPMKESLIHCFGADTVLHCGSYTTDALERIAERIFDEDVIDRARDREDSLDMELD